LRRLAVASSPRYLSFLGRTPRDDAVRRTGGRLLEPLPVWAIVASWRVIRSTV